MECHKGKEYAVRLLLKKKDFSKEDMVEVKPKEEDREHPCCQNGHLPSPIAEGNFMKLGVPDKSRVWRTQCKHLGWREGQRSGP